MNQQRLLVESHKTFNKLKALHRKFSISIDRNL